MLNVSITPHRDFFPVDAPTQKLFVMLRLAPTQEVSATRPVTHFAFIIDTSGSMYEVVAGDPKPTGQSYSVDGKSYQAVSGGITKLDIVIQSLNALLDSGRLDEQDQVAIIQFDNQASTLAPLTPATETGILKAAINRLTQFSGGTCMGLGMKHALELFHTESMASKHSLIFTDGQTFDEDLCQQLGTQFSHANIPITALGVGDYNADLLTGLTDKTAGRFFHVDNQNGIPVQSLPETILEEFSKAQQDVITNLGLSIKTVQGVRLSRVMRVYPDKLNFPLASTPYPIGNAQANDETVFILDFDIDSRPAGRIRIAQVGLTYDVPGQNKRGELPPQNLVMQFVVGAPAVQVDPVVMGYLQQANIRDLIDQASQADNPEQAADLLDKAEKLTERIQDPDVRKTINMAKDELRKTKRISDGTRKTMKMNSRGKTQRMDGDPLSEINDDLIRQQTGT
jgi:Ca-activated chloride channel family protein